MDNIENKNKNISKKLLTLSEFRRELGIPLVLARKMIVWGEVGAIRALDGTFRIAESELVSARALLKNPVQKFRYFLRALGPGLITGASDDDPSGIGTYSSVGARFGLAILWMAVWLLPVMLAVQESCARIGIVTNKGLAGVLQKHYKKKVVVLAVVLLIFANIINIGADLGAMAAALEMLTGINFFAGAVLFSVVTIVLEIFVGYHVYVKFLKWMSAAVLSYVAAGFMIHPDWHAIVSEMFVPRIILSKEYAFAMIAVFGTTITPYLFFWQTSEEVEENNLTRSFSKKTGEKEPPVCYRVARMRTDVSTGMILANIVFFFIIITTAQVFFKNGITGIESAEAAALALKPLVGDYAYALFAFGIIGTGLLAVPILAGSGAYAASELLKWKEGLELKYAQAKGFYLIIAISIILGMSLNFFHINPIAALYYSAFINGIIALPLLVVIMKLGSDSKIMGEETSPLWVKFFGWLAVFSMVFMILFLIALELFRF